MTWSTRRRVAWLALAAAGLGVLSVSLPAVAADQTPQAVTGTPRPVNGEVRPASLGSRERVGLPVFLVVLWLIIAFLLFFLRLRIREADRVFRTGLYQSSGSEKTPRKL